MEKHIKISAIVIAKNEERNIARCVESQLSCVDEIVVIVDFATTDRTVEILQQYDEVRVEIAEWKGYSAAKEFALTKTTNDWVLWIDADEEVTAELAKELQQFKLTHPKFDAYKIARRAYFLDKWIKHGGWYPGYVTRLFNKKKARFNTNEVHEGLIIDGSISKFENDLNHYTDPDVFHYFTKFNNYTSLAAKELSEKDRRASLADLLLRPFFLFVKMYFIRGGFWDGIPGFVLAVFSANYVFTKYVKLREKNKSNLS